MFTHPSSPIVWLILSWLAAWRVTMMLAYEAGPFDVFSWFRLLLTRIGLGRLATCFHCMGVWVSTVIVMIMFELEPRSIVLLLAVAGGVSMTERALDREARDV